MLRKLQEVQESQQLKGDCSSPTSHAKSWRVCVPFSRAGTAVSERDNTTARMEAHIWKWESLSWFFYSMTLPWKACPEQQPLHVLQTPEVSDGGFVFHGPGMPIQCSFQSSMCSGYKWNSTWIISFNLHLSSQGQVYAASLTTSMTQKMQTKDCWTAAFIPVTDFFPVFVSDFRELKWICPYLSHTGFCFPGVK